MFLDIFDHVAHRQEFFRLFIRHFDAEFLFQRHDQFHSVERIGTEILNKLGRRNDLFGFYPELFDDNVFYALINRFV